jgi:uncharacterized protein YeaC (DUF1315 family)
MAKQTPKNQKTKSNKSQLSGNVRSEETEINEEIAGLKKLADENEKLIKQKEEQIRLAEEKYKLLVKEGKETKKQEARWFKLNQELEEFKKNQSDVGEQFKKMPNRLDAVNKKIEQSNKSIRQSLDSFEEIDKVLGSINSTIREGADEELQLFQKQLEGSKAAIQGISTRLQTQRDLTEEQVKLITKTTQQYGNSIAKVAELNLSLSKGSVDLNEYNSGIVQSISSFQKLKDSIDTSTESGRILKERIDLMAVGMEKFQKAAEASQKYLQATSFASDKLAGSIPRFGGELNTVIKEAISGGKGMTMAVAALGAAVGVMLYDFGVFGDKLGTIAKYQIPINNINAEIEKIKTAIEFGMTPDGKKLANGTKKPFAQQRAELQRQFKRQRDIAKFEADAATAIFGKTLGEGKNFGLKSNIADLVEAGIGAKDIADQMKTVSDEMGRLPSTAVAEDMAVFAKQSDVSAQTMAKVSRLFGATSNASAKTALNMQAAMKSLADKKGLNFQRVMENVEAQSESVLTYTTRNSAQLQRNAFYAASMAIDQKKINQLGESMVLNYKDSIKAEMQLSSLLGESVDLSEVRARFAEGDTAGAMEALKAQGLNPDDMNAFQKQALQQAVPGLSMTDFSNLLSGKAVDTGAAGTGMGNVEKMNKDFLDRVAKSITNLQAKEVNIDGAEKLKMADLNRDLENAIQEAIIANTFGLKDLMNDLKKAEFFKDAQVGLESAAFALLGAAAALGARGLINKMFPKGWLKNMFKGPGGKSMFGGAEKTGASITKKAPPSSIKFNEKTGRYHTVNESGKTGKMVSNTKAQEILKAEKVAMGTTDDVAKVGAKGGSKVGNILGKGAKVWAAPFQKAFGGIGKMIGKIGGGAAAGAGLSGIFGAFDGYTTSMEKQKEAIDEFTTSINERTDLTDEQKAKEIDKYKTEARVKASGAAGVQGGAALAGSIAGGALGSFIGPVGTMVGAAIGGFIGDSIGGWLNEKAPWLAESVSKFFGGFVNAWETVKTVFASVQEKFGKIGDSVGSLFNTIGGLFDKLSGSMGMGEGGFGSILSKIGSFIGEWVLLPINLLLGVFGLLADALSGLFKLCDGVFTLFTDPKKGLEMIGDAFITMFTGIGDFLKNAFGGLWNSLLDMLPKRVQNWGIVKSMRVEMPGQKEKDKADATSSMISRMAASVDEKGIIQKQGSQFKGTKWEDYVKNQKITDEQLKGVQIGKKVPTTQEVTSITSQIDQASAQALTASIQENVQVQKYASKLNEENKKNLAEINANTKAMVELTKAMQVIAAAQYQYATTKTAPIKLSVDGKTLANAAVKYENNNKAGKKPGT